MQNTRQKLILKLEAIKQELSKAKTKEAKAFWQATETVLIRKLFSIYI